jgi:transcription antitermination factor NusG
METTSAATGDILPFEASLNTVNIASRWAVFQAQASREVYACDHLNAQGFITFLPVQKIRLKRGRRLIEAEKALFPGYGFVAINAASRWRSINGTRGVKRLIAGDRHPLVLPEGFVENLISLVNNDGYLDLGSTFKNGETVQMINGPFAGIKGRISELGPHGRVTLLISLLSSEVQVQTVTSALTKAG